MLRSRARLIVIGGLAVALVAGVVIATGRGDDGMPKAEYERRVQALYGRVQQAFLATRVSDPADLDDRVAGAQAELRSVADELDALDPPPDVEVHNAALADAMRDYADDLEALREAAARGDTAAIERFNSRITTNEAVRRMAAAGEGMKELGYDVGPLGED
jgi:hypothetical protein